jgi:ATP-binding cassette, subfamily B, bacterial PglK
LEGVGCLYSSEIFLIDDSFKKNIALGIIEEFIDEAQINKVIGLARLENLVNQLPLGVDTIIGERGISISGGQRQRIAWRAHFISNVIF